MRLADKTVDLATAWFCRKLTQNLNKQQLRNLCQNKETVIEPRCNRAAWVRSRLEPQELIDVQLERQLATR